MEYQIRIYREWSCAHRGAPQVTYPSGVYSVPEDISPVLAQRCIDSGLGRRMNSKPKKRGNKMLRVAPENKADERTSA